MSDVEPVRLVKDNGYKTRWGLDRILYRQDGKKLTVEKKRIIWACLGIFCLSSVFALFRGPVALQERRPITPEGALQGSQSFELPPAPPSYDRKKIGKGTQVRYTGLELIKANPRARIPPGTFVKAKLSLGASNGLVKAVLTENLANNGEVFADSGAVLVGNGSSTEDRLLVEFSKVVARDGAITQIRAQACDASDQSIGLKGSRLDRYGGQMAASVGLNFAAGLAQGLQRQDVQGGVAVRKTDFQDAALNGLETASIEQSRAILDKWKQQKAIISVPKDTEICVVFAGDQ